MKVTVDIIEVENNVADGKVALQCWEITHLTVNVDLKVLYLA